MYVPVLAPEGEMVPVEGSIVKPFEGEIEKIPPPVPVNITGSGGFDEPGVLTPLHNMLSW